MDRVTKTSFAEITHRRAPLNRRIRDAEATRSRNVQGSTLPTLKTLREALFFCPGLPPDELEGEPLEPGMQSTPSQNALRPAKG